MKNSRLGSLSRPNLPSAPWPAALFLDDQPHLPLDTRKITEWDSLCCLFAFMDGTVVKIPENPLILPSVTIQGITAILREMGIAVHERYLAYGELRQRAQAGELVAACSIGAAGILNRCQKLVLVAADGSSAGVHHPQEQHELFSVLGKARNILLGV
jgi:branched-subunit amino acid aminotransferase/4-amino-4-deoxychorismate lyase